MPEGNKVPDALPSDGKFAIDGHDFFGINVPQGDIPASSFLHVPDLGLVACGDIVYGDCYQFFGETKTPEKRKKWIESLDQTAALKPHIVVPGHKRASQADGPYLIEATKAYILAFEEELGRTKNVGELEKAMTARYPHRRNRFLLERSCEGSVQASKKSQAT